MKGRLLAVLPKCQTGFSDSHKGNIVEIPIIHRIKSKKVIMVEGRVEREQNIRMNAGQVPGTIELYFKVLKAGENDSVFAVA